MNNDINYNNNNKKPTCKSIFSTEISFIHNGNYIIVYLFYFFKIILKKERKKKEEEEKKKKRSIRINIH